jgi:UMF1 family MFS transporter
MSLDEGIPEPSYPGEDTRPTSKKELLGFYAYSFAAEVFVVCGLGAFIPITLEDLARASPSAVLAHDHTKSCRAHGIERSLDADSTSIFSRGDLHDPASRKGAQCVFSLLGWEMNTASFAMYTFSISVLIQAILVVTMSGAADHGRYRKKLLIGFAVLGAIATMLYLPVTPNLYLLGSLWAIVGNVCFGASFVLLNSFLPLLVRWHPSTGSSVAGRERQGDWYQNEEVSLSCFLDSILGGVSILAEYRIHLLSNTQHGQISRTTFLPCNPALPASTATFLTDLFIVGRCRGPNSELLKATKDNNLGLHSRITPSGR